MCRAEEAAELQRLSKKRKEKKVASNTDPETNEELGRGRRTKTNTEKRRAQRSNYLHEKADSYLSLLDLPGHPLPTDPAYIAAHENYKERKLRAAIDKLEALVVRRLFELQKCHVVGTSKYHTCGTV